MAWRYVVRRLAQVVPSLLMIVAVMFVVIHLAPGDPAGAVAGEYADQATIEHLRRQFGLDRPLWSQFGTYLGRLARGDLGESFQYARPVSTMIRERLPATLLLSGTALVMSVSAGILMGLVATRRPGGALDTGVRGIALLGYAIPAFWLGQVAILIFGLRFRIFPVVGMTDTQSYTGFDQVFDVGRHMVLPVLVLAASEVALIIRLTRTGLIQQMGENYVRAAQAKGLAWRTALEHHAFPNAALPLITVIGTRVGFLLSGTVIVENVFSWPGVGVLLVNAMEIGDRPMAIGLVLLVAVGVLFANLLTDLVYAWVDPRIRFD